MPASSFHIEKYSNLFLKKQKTSIIVRYSILSVTLSSSCGLTSTAIPKPKLIISIPKLCINNVDITDQKLICNSMNNYFCSVGSNLAEKKLKIA